MLSGYTVVVDVGIGMTAHEVVGKQGKAYHLQGFFEKTVGL